MSERAVPVWRGTNLTRIGDFNEAVLVDAIRRSPHGLSRVELAHSTGLSPQTISNISRRMIDAGLIAEGARLQNGQGKPRTMLHLNPEGAYAVGVHLDPTMMTFVLVDLLGTVVARSRLATPPASPDLAVETVTGSVFRLIESAGIGRDRITGIGFASPGPIDVEAGLVLDPPHLPGWRDVPLRERLAQATGLPVILDKDVVAAAVGERWAGATMGYHDSVFVYLSTGIGTGLIVGDAVVRGASGNAGDIGHLVIAPDGPPCDCGLRGCLGISLSPAGLVEQAVLAGALPATSRPTGQDEVAAAFEELCRRHDEGQSEAVAVIRRAARWLAKTAQTLANLTDTQIVTFGGPTWTRLEKAFLDAMPADVLNRGSLGTLPVAGSQLGEDVGALGAACLVLDQAFSPRPSTFVLT